MKKCNVIISNALFFPTLVNCIVKTEYRRLSYVRTVRALVTTIAAGVDRAGVSARCVAAFVRAAFLIGRTLSVSYASGNAIGHGVPHRTVAAFV